MNNYDLKKLQKTELDILIDFADFCKEKGLKYYLIGGALLGAARYHGFIPWDDDVDVAMPREDYEKLKVIYSSDKYFLQNSDTDLYFGRCIQKIRLNGTQIIEKTCQDVNMHNGIYIDIFPIDYADSSDSKPLLDRAKKIRLLMSYRTIKSGYISGKYSFIKRLIKLFVPLSLKKADSMINNLCTAENNSQRNYAVLFLHNYPLTKQTHDISVFAEGTLCEFEGHKFIAPSKTDEFLKKVFGENYMQEPPKEKQKTPHHYLSVKYDI